MQSSERFFKHLLFSLFLFLIKENMVSLSVIVRVISWQIIILWANCPHMIAQGNESRERSRSSFFFSSFSCKRTIRWKKKWFDRESLIPGFIDEPMDWCPTVDQPLLLALMATLIHSWSGIYSTAHQSFLGREHLIDRQYMTWGS